MATANNDESTTPVQVNEMENNGNMSDLSDSDSDEEILNLDEPPKVEWLATGREKRSTAGNRMKSMIAAQDPDDDLELLFAEDDDDAGFTDVEGNVSDVQMDSSSDDEDGQENGDDLEGEKELEKQARESKQAARKRKAQEAIPVKFRKKVKIDTSRTSSMSVTPTAPKPRPKKKSERLSWLPTAADMPTRASRRETTMAGKEQLHKQMAEREVRRLQQIEAMERKAKKMEALKKPPMTQAERLAEAALVEKRNAKSLNRWEEAEKQREEERKAKLAALNNRTLEGPVVTFWSGVGEWIDGKLKHVGKFVTIEEKPVKRKRASNVHDGLSENADKTSLADQMQISPKDDKTTNTLASTSTAIANATAEATNASSTSAEGHSTTTASIQIMQRTTSDSQPSQQVVEDIDTRRSSITSHPFEVAQISQSKAGGSDVSDNAADVLNPTAGPTAPPNDSQPHISPPIDTKTLDLKPPDLRSPSPNVYTTSMFAPLSKPGLMKPPDLKPPNSCLAPPAGISKSGLTMPMIGYHSSPSTGNTCNVLAPPTPQQRQSPLSMPQLDNRPSLPPPPPVSVQTPSRPAISLVTPKSTPSVTATSQARRLSKTPLSSVKPTKVNLHKHQPKEASPPPLSSPPANGRATRNCIIMQNFNDNAIKDKSVQTRILFNKEMNKLPKPSPAPRCVITNHPAKYRDPKTGLPYYNAYAYKEIRKLCDGEYKWSSMLGAWVGTGAQAAQGVPARFLDPHAPAPIREKTDLSPPASGVPNVPDGTQATGSIAPNETQTSSVPSTPTLPTKATPVLSQPGQESSRVQTSNTPVTSISTNIRIDSTPNNTPAKSTESQPPATLSASTSADSSSPSKGIQGPPSTASITEQVNGADSTVRLQPTDESKPITWLI
ncbi:YL1-domain-containing protein [Xylariaceae sp. FL1019]|nr:YL1-domain-containing protein [Xylariaceae sp. FL1019]